MWQTRIEKRKKIEKESESLFLKKIGIKKMMFINYSY